MFKQILRKHGELGLRRPLDAIVSTATRLPITCRCKLRCGAAALGAAGEERFAAQAYRRHRSGECRAAARDAMQQDIRSATPVIAPSSRPARRRRAARKYSQEA